MRAALTVLLLAFGGPLPLTAQAGVTGVRPLAFGTVLPGVADVVLPTDPVNSGQFNLTGRANGFAFLRFTLPASMAGPAGATLPLVFAATDAGYSASQSVGNQVLFDPRAFRLVRLSATGRGSVFLGGTALPAVGQRAGDYTGTVTLSVVFF